MPLTWTDLFRLVLSAFIGGLGGAIVAALLAARREQTQRRHAFIERQLRDFYSPLLGLRSEIRMRSELRVKTHREADRVWRELVEDARRRGGIPALEQLSRERNAEFDRIIDLDERKEFIAGVRSVVVASCFESTFDKTVGENRFNPEDWQATISTLKLLELVDRPTD